MVCCEMLKLGFELTRRPAADDIKALGSRAKRDGVPVARKRVGALCLFLMGG